MCALKSCYASTWFLFLEEPCSICFNLNFSVHNRIQTGIGSTTLLSVGYNYLLL